MTTCRQLRAAVVLAVSSMCVLGQATVFDLASNWSDVNNPNGAWSLWKAPGQLFTVNQSDYWSDQSFQRAWADDPYPQQLHVPFWMKVTTVRGDTDCPAGTILMHGSDPNRTPGNNYTAAIWTAPNNGIVTILGDNWMAAKSLPRGMIWTLARNSTTFSTGELWYSDNFSSQNPKSLALGTGGPGALTFPIVKGDRIEFAWYPQPTTYPWLVGLHYTIELLEADETLVPSTMTVNLGKVTAGNVASLADDDANVLTVCKFFVPNLASPYIRLTCGYVTTKPNPTMIELAVQARSQNAGLFKLRGLLLNQTSGVYDTILDEVSLTTGELSLAGVKQGNLGHYVGSGGSMSARIEVRQAGPSAALFPCDEFDLVNLAVKG